MIKHIPKGHFQTDELRARWESVCERVIGSFALPQPRLLCFFDDLDVKSLHEQFGPFRGFSTPIPTGAEVVLPEHVCEVVDVSFDFLVYLPGPTCAGEDCLFVMTLAHELQHFIQWGNESRTWELNNRLRDCFKRLVKSGQNRNLQMWNVPSEREAMTVSKRVAENILGEQVVKAFVNSQISARNGKEEREKAEWKFLQALSPSVPYDLGEETSRLVKQHRPECPELG